MSKGIKGSGIGISDALTILFVGLKLHGSIDWSWWWIISPSWIAIILNIVIAILSKDNE